MTLATRIGGGFLLLVAVMAAVSAYHLVQLDRLHEESEELVAGSFEAAKLSLELRGDAELLDEFSDKLRVSGDERYAAELADIREGLELDLSRLEILGGLTPAEEAAAARLRAHGREIGVAEPALAEAVLAGSDREAERLGTLLDERFAALQTGLDELFTLSRQAMDRRVAASRERLERARRLTLVAAVAALAAAIVASVLIVRSVAGPLGRLTEGTRQLSKGDFSFRVEASGSPELTSLARDFNAMAERLGELDRLKEDLISNVSHDLKAPLASMRETSRVLLEEIAGPLNERQQRLLQLQLDSGDRLSMMIGNLLELSRLESGVADYTLRPLDLAHLADIALQSLHGLVEQRQLTVEGPDTSEPVVVAGAGDLLLQALANLLSNAVKFTPRGGTMGVRLAPVVTAGELPPGAPRNRAREILPAALVEVWDTGPGVPDAHKERIFDRFHRADSGKKGSQGTGLGLAIARSVADGHGGALWVADRPGGGSS